MRRQRRQPGSARRRGTLMPAIALAILVVCVCAALVFDRLWLDAARIELRTAAEAAALAAAGRLVSDDRLRTGSDPIARLDEARETAVIVAASNRVAGSRVQLNPAPGSDVRFGKVIDDPHTGAAVFLETDFDPMTVLVTARAIRSRGNGVALFFRGLTGVSTGNVIARAGVTIDNRILGVRPFAGFPIPAIPLGILESDPSGQRDDTWRRQISERQGTDRYGFDETTQLVMNAPDGIPEITLVAAHGSVVGTTDADDSATSSNCCAVDVGNGLKFADLRRQLADGWSADDMTPLGGEFLPADAAVTIVGSVDALVGLEDDLRPLIGQGRICALYQHDGSNTGDGALRIHVTGLAAGRILSVERTSDGLQIAFQPAVLTTPAAVLALDRQDVAPNPYVYKLHLTH